jgi:hypothetical protein
MIFFKRSNSFNISSRREDNPAPPPAPAATGAAGADPEAIGAVAGFDGGGLIPGGAFIKEGFAFIPGGPAPGAFGGSLGGGGNPEGDFGGALGGLPGGPDFGALGGPDGGADAVGGPDGAAAGTAPPSLGPPDNILNSKFAAFSRAF